MDAESEIAERINDLEIKFAFQQDSLESLSNTVTEQWSEIDRLKKLLARLQGQLADLEDAQGPVDPGNIKPPHY